MAKCISLQPIRYLNLMPVSTMFANCSLEHMDHLDAVLSEIHRCLKPGGTLLCSVADGRLCSVVAVAQSRRHGWL